MAADEDDLLVGGLAGLGGYSGRRVPEKMTRKISKNVFELDVELWVPVESATEKVRDILAQLGRVVHVEGAAGSSGTQVIGMMGAGFGKLNPAVVTVTIHPMEAGARLVIRGAAKEGLIKQRAGEAAAKRVAAALA